MSYHGKTVFGKNVNQPHMSFRMWNAGTTTCNVGDVVCFYPHQTTTTKMWFNGYSAGDAIPNVNTWSTSSRMNVCGVVHNASIAGGASGSIVFGGVLASVYAVGTITAQDRLQLSGTTKTATVNSSATDRGEGYCFGFAMTSLDTTVREHITALLVPWRI